MNKKQEIVPHLWFDTEAVEAAEFYCSLFPDSRILSRRLIEDTPSGDCDSLSFIIWGQRFEAISAGPYFKLNPSISIMVNFDPLFFNDQENPESAARNKINQIWEGLSEGGQPLMELGSYDFSPLYGWIKDRFGLTWQLILTDPGGEPRPPVMPSLLFTGNNCGKAEEAGDFYRSLFPSSESGLLVRYPAGMEFDKEGSVMFSDFKLGETWITAMDSGYRHEFQFNEAVSFILFCRDQSEIDYFWDSLSAVPEAEQCGWLKDKYGLSWQIVPEVLNRMMDEGSASQKEAVTKAFLKMKKFNIEKLRSTFKDAGV